MTQRTAIAVAFDCQLWAAALPGAEALVRKAARAALTQARRDGAPVPDGVELSLVLADATLMRRLNRDYRRKDKPTNVLSFPAYDPAELARIAAMAATAEPVAIGDVILAYEVVSQEAAEQGKRLADHVVHLTVHGTLHLLGYDHESDADAASMEALEVAILEGLGVADPYAEDAPEPTLAKAVAHGTLAKAGRHG